MNLKSNFRAETNLKKYRSQYCSAEQVKCKAVYFRMRTAIFLKYFILLFLNLKHNSKYYHCQANIPILSPCYIPLGASIETCKLIYVIDYTQTFRFCTDFSLIYPKKSSHIALICFRYFCILLVQISHNNIKTTLYREIL